MSKKKSFFGKIFKSPTKNHRLIFIIILSLALSIPVIWAVANANLVDSKGFLGTPFEISLYDSAQELIVSDSAMVEYASPRSAVSIFNNILSNMRKENVGKVDSSLFADPFYADITKGNLTESYRFYFSEKDNCYCMDQSNQIFLIPQEDANAFLNSSYSESIYSSATPPKLVTGNGESIIPSYANWNYRTQAGEFVKAATIPISLETLVYEISGNLNISFDTEPTSCRLQIYRDDTLVFDGNYSDIEDLTIDTGTRLKIYLFATWDYNSTTPYYGDIKYVFYADINNYADFSLSRNQLSPNEFLIISGTNVEDVSKIKFTPILQTDSLLYIYPPIFQSDGNFVRAFLPFPSSLETGLYCFNISYGAFSKDFSVELLPSSEEYDIYNSGKPFSDIYNMSSIETQTNFINKVQSIPTDIPENIYLNNNLASPEELGLTCEYSFGTLITCDDESFAFSALGNRYTKEGEINFSVTALNNGKVIYTGHCDYLGNFVVIEHGLGFRTWYCNLNSINVSVGEYVICGEQLGRSGEHSSSAFDGFLLLCSYQGIIIDSKFCIENGILNELGAKN